MQTLTTPQTNNQLEAALNVLHSESREWLSEVEFLKSELRFFLKLLNSKVFSIGKDEQRQHIFKNMDNLATTVISELEQEVRSHETNLSVLLTAKKDSSDAPYRTKHKELQKKVDQVINDTRTLKMLVFAFVEHLK